MEYKYTIEALRKLIDQDKNFTDRVLRMVKSFLNGDNKRLVCDSLRGEFVEEYTRINGIPPVTFLDQVLVYVNMESPVKERKSENELVDLAKETSLPVLNGDESIIKRYINFSLNAFELEIKVLNGFNNIELRKNAQLNLYSKLTIPAYRFMLNVLDAYIDSMTWGFDRKKMLLNVALAHAACDKEKVKKEIWNDRDEWTNYVNNILGTSECFEFYRKTFKKLITFYYNKDIPDFFNNLEKGKVNSNTFKVFIRGFFFNVFKPDETFIENYSLSDGSPKKVKAVPVNSSPKETSKKVVSKKTKKKKPFNLTGRKELNSFFNESVIDIIENGEAYKRFGIGFPEPFILEGPPGCGKTFAVTQLEKYLDIPSYHITSSNVGSSFIHETAKKIEGVFEEAKENERSMVIIDEMESFMPNRGNARSDQHFLVEETNSFLKCLQTAQENNILVVGMTNFIERVDPAILRSGRMGTHIKVEWPSEEEITEVLKYEFKKRPHERMSLKDYASRFLERPLSDVAAAVRRAAMSAARRRAEKINKKDLEDAIDFVLPKEKKEERRVMGFLV